MIFEFDVAKSASNKLKHSIDFLEAQELWVVSAVVVHSDRGGEVRYARIALHSDARLWTAFYTYRGTNIRTISVRPASRSERQLYERLIP